MQLFGIAETGDTPSIVHQSSIDPPSKRWTIDGVSMEEEGKNSGVSYKEYPLFLG